MSLRYVYSLLFFLVINAVADINLGYYFVNDGPLRSLFNLKSCKTEAMVNDCNQKCGPNHACLLGQCFCVKKKSLSEEYEDGGLSIEESSVEYTSEDDTSVEDTSVENTGTENFDENDEHEQENPSSLESISIDEKLATRPTLRHHIAHFCPNLKVARACIRKCMSIDKPAFCGKDHICYCGHQYEFPGKEPEMKASEVRNQFYDLYEKYFGPRSSSVEQKQQEAQKLGTNRY